MNRINFATKFVPQVVGALLALALTSPADARLFSDPRSQVKQFVEDLTAAVGRNDVATLGRYLSEDWSIVSGDGTVINRATFLQVLGSGDLVRQSMSPEDQTIRLYGSTAVVTAHVQIGGSYKGAPFHMDQMSTDVIVKMHGHWLCVLTQLTTVIPH